jgi:hypothetical protein
VNVASKRKRKRSVRWKCFREAGDRAGAWSYEYSDTAIPGWPRRDRVEGVDVETTSVGSDIAVSDAIRPLKCATIGKAEIPRIVTGTTDRLEMRTGVPETHSANRPSTRREIRYAIRVGMESAICPEGKIVKGRE